MEWRGSIPPGTSIIERRYMNNWKTIKKGDYLYALDPDHPNATKNGYVLEHRKVVENSLGRYLKQNEIVHHKDGDKHNNSIDNLEIMTRSEHTRLHMLTGRTKLEFVCPNCGLLFSKEIKNYKRDTIPKCSRKCNGEYSRKIQLNRL